MTACCRAIGDTIIISGPKRKHAEILSLIADFERQIDQHRANLVHIDGALRLVAPNIDLKPLPVCHRPPERSSYFGRGEITRHVRKHSVTPPAMAGYQPMK